MSSIGVAVQIVLLSILLQVSEIILAKDLEHNVVRTGFEGIDFVPRKDREKFSIESWEPPSDIARNYPYYLSGYDSDDHAILVLLLGKWDVMTMAKNGGQGWIDLQRHAEKMIYNVKNGRYRRRFVDVNNRNATYVGSEDVVIIVDWDDYSLIQLISPDAAAFVLKYLGQMEKFQEKISYGFFVNVNPIANAAINALRPVLGRFMERVEIYGPQRSSWIPVVRRHLPEDQISPKYGGLPGFKPLVYHG